MIVGNHYAMGDLAFFMLSPPAVSYLHKPLAVWFYRLMAGRHFISPLL